MRHSMGMCNALDMALAEDLITYHEYRAAKGAIREYLDAAGTSYLETALAHAGLNDSPAAQRNVYLDWHNRPPLTGDNCGL